MIRYVSAYNSVMRQAVEQRFGPDVFQTAEAKASARYVARSTSAAPQ
jgi:hypothetical protein